jgi:hypothetical protein
LQDAFTPRAHFLIDERRDALRRREFAFAALGILFIVNEKIKQKNFFFILVLVSKPLFDLFFYKCQL